MMKMSETTKELSKRIAKLASQLGLCLKLPEQVVDQDAATEALSEMRDALNLAEAMLRRDGKLTRATQSSN
jgi:hypothetical protein